MIFRQDNNVFIGQ
jgi:transposase